MKPTMIGLAVGVLALATGCRSSTPVESIASNASPRLQFGVMQSESGSDWNPPPYVATLPVDDQAKLLGHKVFSKKESRLLRSPRDSAPEYYRVGPGTPLFVTPTQDRRWLQVRLSKGRSAYVRTDSTSAALSLALAQGAISDKARLSPKPSSNNEADAGDGKSTAPSNRSAEVEQALEDVQTNATEFESAFDRLEAESNGFEGSQDGWPAVRDSCLQQVNAFATKVEELNRSLDDLAALSSQMNASERSAFQSLNSHLSGMAQSVQSVRQSLSNMKEGEDWTSLVASLRNEVRALAASVDSVMSAADRLG